MPTSIKYSIKSKAYVFYWLKFGGLTPQLARRTAAARSLDVLLFAFIILVDDRAVVDTSFA